MAIKTTTYVSIGSLAPVLGVSERTVKNYLKLLTEAKIIAYTGTTNNGQWNITLKECSHPQ